MILIPLPSYGFDPTEAAIPYIILKSKKVPVVFATPSGIQACADVRLLTGEGFGPFKKMLMADNNARLAYEKMEKSEEFRNPISYEQIDVSKYEGLILPGGHDKGMREYLESVELSGKVAEFFALNKPVGAICHGTVVAARAIDPETEESVLWKHQTTALLNVQELGAYTLTRLWLKDYYRTYPQTVEDEVRDALQSPKQFHTGPLPKSRDRLWNDKPSFVVEDGNYISARWPGDARTFARKYYALLMKNRGLQESV